MCIYVCIEVYFYLSDGDKRKPVPGMALLPVLPLSDDKMAAGLAPRPPDGAPPAKSSTGKLASRKLYAYHVFTKSIINSCLHCIYCYAKFYGLCSTCNVHVCMYYLARYIVFPILYTSSQVLGYSSVFFIIYFTLFVNIGQYKSLSSSKAVQFSDKPKPSRYDWVPVGMLDYNSERKLYLVKREHPNDVRPKRGGVTLVCFKQIHLFTVRRYEASVRSSSIR